MMSKTGKTATFLASRKKATVYYNLHGMRMDNPGKGVYIQRKESKSRKVTIK